MIVAASALILCKVKTQLTPLLSNLEFLSSQTLAPPITSARIGKRQRKKPNTSICNKQLDLFTEENKVIDFRMVEIWMSLFLKSVITFLNFYIYLLIACVAVRM